MQIGPILIWHYKGTRLEHLGEGDDDGGADDDDRISPEHPGPILHAPRDSISREGKPLTPTILYGFVFKFLILIIICGEFPILIPIFLLKSIKI